MQDNTPSTMVAGDSSSSLKRIVADNNDLLLFDEEEELSAPATLKSHAFQTSFSFDEANDQFESVLLPPPPVRHATARNFQQYPSVTSQTPLFGNLKQTAREPRRFRRTNDLLFGRSNLDAPRNLTTTTFDDDSDDMNIFRPTGLAGFFFGFMYEDRSLQQKDSMILREMVGSSSSSSSKEKIQIWNRLNWALFLGFTLTVAATAVPVTLVPQMANDFYSEENANNSVFSARAAASAVMGTACGKVLNGPVGDLFGARRVSCVYSVLLAISLLALSFCHSAATAVWACFFVEFFQSVQWPCIVVVLAAHYRTGNPEPGMYEGGIYVTSLASRFGALLAIPISSYLLRSMHWRKVAHIGALVSLAGTAVMFLFVSDSPGKTHDPQNPIRPSLIANAPVRIESSWLRRAMRLASVVRAVFITNVFPAIRSVLKSGTFWIVAIAHTGGSMVRSSDRILGTYFRDTSFGTLSENRAGGLAVFLSFGVLLGLAVGGNTFTRLNPRSRKRMVSRLYMLAIAACYFLAFLAIPKVRWLLGSPGIVLILQVIAVLAAGFGVAVQCYHIPGLVSMTFGHNKGLYAAYTDGIAYGLGSVVWRIVGNAVKEGNPQGGGWAYGWAAVALILVLCAVLMVEFMEHYFVFRTNRDRPRGGYETIIFV